MEIMSEISIADKLMVIITLVYTVATILICVFNFRSTKTAKDTLVETDKIQKENIKINLWEMRIEIYNRCTEIIDEMNDEDNPYIISITEKYNLIQKAKFLFGDDIFDYLQEMLTNVDKYNAKKEIQMKTDKKLQDSEYMELFKYFRRQLQGEMTDKFKSYLDLSRLLESDEIDN